MRIMGPLLSKPAAACLALGFLLTPAPAQQADSPAEDAGFLENLIQNALGGEGRTVRVQGLSGVLSSQASIAAITIADDDGAWLRVADVTLDWRRLALLRGRLEVNALSVGRVEVLRQPLPPPAAPPKLAADPDAAPEPFSLPELPVSVNVAQLSVGVLQLAEPVLGYAADLSISGAARLQGGEGTANLTVVRVDGHASRYALAAGFVNATQMVTVDLAVTEAADGLITTLSGIPDSPSLDLTLAGNDPLSDFTADLAFRTDDVERLAGQIALRDLPDTTPPEREITADVGGDVADLFLPDYRDFFGRRVDLNFRARQGEAVGFDISDLTLLTRGMQLRGSVDLSPAFLPQDVDLTARIGTDLGLPVVLPIPGPPMLVHDADLSLTYDEEDSDSFALDFAGTGVMRADGLLLDALSLSTTGQLTKAAPTDITSALADVAVRIDGFSTTDAALWDAVGDGLDGRARVDWQRDGPLRVDRIDLTAGDLGVGGVIDVTGLTEGAIAVQADIDARAGDLSRFAAISGQTLGGGIDATLRADYDTVSGAFTAVLDGAARDLQIGDDAADGLLTGAVDLGITAARNADGLSLDRLEIAGTRIDITGRGGIDPQGWPRAVQLSGRIGAPDGAPVFLPAPGPRMSLQSAELDLSYDPETGEAFDLTLDARDFRRAGEAAMNRAMLRGTGTLRRDGNAVAGVAAQIDAALSGLSATDPNVSAAVAPGLTFDANFDWDAAEDTLDLAELNLRSGDLRVSGDGTVSGLAGDAMAIDTRIDAATGPLRRFAALAGIDLSGSADARGTVRFAPNNGFFDVDLRAEGRDLATGIAEADQLIGGTSRIVARAARDDGGLRIDEATLTTRELSADVTGGMTGDVTTLQLEAALRDVGLFAPGFNGPLTLTGTARNDAETWSVNADVTGPQGSTAQAVGEVLRPDGTMDLRVTGGLPLGLVNQFILPRTIAGRTTFDVTVNGTPGLDAVTGNVRVAGARITDPTLRLALEDLGLTVGLEQSRAQIDAGANLSSGGRITLAGPVNLTGGFEAALRAQLNELRLVDPTLYEVGLGGQIDVTGPLAGGANIVGRIDIGRSEIRIPNVVGGGGAVPDIVHLNEDQASLQTRTRAGVVRDEGADANGGGGGPVYGLDMVISAPRQIFVRGRGLDVEMGGIIAVRGTTAAPQPEGGLRLIRGRLDLLSERLVFDQAEISLQGDLAPDINMVASSNNGGVRSQIIIEGPVDSPEFRFASEPELPEDEVLAQLFFGKPVRDLTPLEVAQLASAINRLRGGGGGVFGFARDALGVDDLSVATDEDGNTAVTAGRYISERVYTDLTVGSDGTSEIELNYEINSTLTARGRFDNEGETGIGLAFERDF
jgi:translocation and assembly module TamB